MRMIVIVPDPDIYGLSSMVCYTTMIAIILVLP